MQFASIQVNNTEAILGILVYVFGLVSVMWKAVGKWTGKREGNVEASTATIDAVWGKKAGRFTPEIHGLVDIARENSAAIAENSADTRKLQAETRNGLTALATVVSDLRTWADTHERNTHA